MTNFMYRFPLQALLNHRRSVEESRRKELAMLETDLARARNELALTAQAMAGLQEDLAPRQACGLGAGQCWLYGAYFKRLLGQMDRDHQKIRTAESACRLKRAEAVKAVQDRKILEKLKEKGFQAFTAESDRQAMRLIDQLATSRHVREKGACQFGDSETEIGRAG